MIPHLGPVSRPPVRLVRRSGRYGPHTGTGERRGEASPLVGAILAELPLWRARRNGLPYQGAFLSSLLQATPLPHTCPQTRAKAWGSGMIPGNPSEAPGQSYGFVCGSHRGRPPFALALVGAPSARGARREWQGRRDMLAIYTGRLQVPPPENRHKGTPDICETIYPLSRMEAMWFAGEMT
jgi:hypothetical protein